MFEALEQLADADDEDFQEALPIPIPVAMLRGLIPIIGRSVPENSDELDSFLTQVGDFCHSMRSDAVARS